MKDRASRRNLHHENVPAMTVRKAFWAVIALFVTNGALMGVWGGSLPTLRAKLAISEGQVSLLLACTGAAGVAAMHFTGKIAEQVGAKIPTFFGAGMQVVALAWLTTATTLTAAISAGVLFGLANGTMDVSMNVLAVEVEQARGRSSMSRTHGSWSIGALAGASTVVAFAGISADAGGRFPYPLLVVAAASLLVLLAAWPFTHDTSLLQRPGSRPHTESCSAAKTAAADPIPSPRTTTSPRGLSALPDTPTTAVGESWSICAPALTERRRLPRSVWLLSLLALCFGITEGTGIDWSSLHVTDVTGVDESTGALGLATLSLLMFLVRMAGDRCVEAVGRRRVVQVAGLVALVGYLLTTTMTSLPAVLFAWGLVGLGVGLLAPQIYGLAGHLGGPRMLATVTMSGYTAFLTGPALIGWLAHSVGLQRAMLAPLVTACALSLLSMRMPELPKS